MTTTLLLYSLSFIPILLITLVAHELGHLVTARAFKIKVSGFHIGIGPPIFSVYAGTTRIIRDSGTAMPRNTTLSPGSIIFAYVSQDTDGNYRADALIPHTTHREAYRLYPEELRRHNATSMQLIGKTKKVAPDHIIIADVKWSLRALPIMAGVFLPEDPASKITNAYNTTTWAKKCIITLAGPAANMALLITAILLIAAIPYTSKPTPVLTVTGIIPHSPADTAGIKVGDRIIQIEHILVPDRDQLKEKIASHAASNQSLHLFLGRRGQDITVQLTPDPDTKRIGISIGTYVPTTSSRAYSPVLVTERFTKFTSTYFGSIASLATAIRTNNSEQAVSGPIVAAYYTAQVIEHAQFRAWLAILATITLTTALVNLLPMPPLDGYRLVVHSIEALHDSKPISPRLERTMIFSGLTVIAIASTYLVLIDILQLMT